MTRHAFNRVVICFLLFISAAFAQSGQDQSDSAIREIKQGTILLQQREYQQAKAHFEQAQTLQGKPTAVTTAGIGLAELQMGHFEAAREMFKLELQFVTNDHARAQRRRIT
jgi:Tfp pilus assembly protein PilF